MAGTVRPLPCCPARIGTGSFGVDGVEFVFHAADCRKNGKPVTEVFGFTSRPADKKGPRMAMARRCTPLSIGSRAHDKGKTKRAHGLPSAPTAIDPRQVAEPTIGPGLLGRDDAAPIVDQVAQAINSATVATMKETDHSAER